MALRKVLAGYTVFVDGIDYLGVASGFTPPPIEAETVESNMPGHGGAFALATGRIGALEAMVSMADAFPQLEALCANPAAVDTPVLFVAQITDGGADPRTIEYEIAGLWTKQERSEFAGAEGSTGGGGGGGRGGGERGPHSYTISCRVFTHRIDGAEIRHIDFEQNIHRIDGADLNEQLRTALRRG